MDDKLRTFDINGKQHILGFKPLSQDPYEAIEPYMGHEFARYVQDKVGELEELSDVAYHKAHTDEQVYEEELNEMCSLLDELWVYFNQIKAFSSKYKKLPEWGHIAEEGMKLIYRNR